MAVAAELVGTGPKSALSLSGQGFVQLTAVFCWKTGVCTPKEEAVPMATASNNSAKKDFMAASEGRCFVCQSIT